MKNTIIISEKIWLERINSTDRLHHGARAIDPTLKFRLGVKVKDQTPSWRSQASIDLVQLCNVKIQLKLKDNLTRNFQQLTQKKL